jgi:hypothetical protein
MTPPEQVRDNEERCPTCGSENKDAAPLVTDDGEVFTACPDPFHDPPTEERVEPVCPPPRCGTHDKPQPCPNCRPEGEAERVPYDPTMECPQCVGKPCHDPDHLAATALYWWRVSEEWHERLTRLQSELDWTKRWADEEIGRLHTDAERYREALRRYGKHDALCSNVGGCTCGLDAVLKEEPAQNPSED